MARLRWSALLKISDATDKEETKGSSEGHFSWTILYSAILMTIVLAACDVLRIKKARRSDDVHASKPERLGL